MAHLPPIHATLRDGRGILIRTATLEDAQAIIDFADHTSRTSEHTVIQPDEVDRDLAKQRERLQKIIEPAGCLWLLACDPAGAVVGELVFKASDRRCIAHHGHFGIAVHADWRSRGVGSALIRALLDWARQSPVVEQVCLGVFANNAHAIRLYKRMGFVEIGRRTREFKIAPGRYIDDIQMMQYVKPESHFQPERTNAPPQP
jgi:ribosomal protein S18 acetylase RimI-like enzyme